MDKRVLITLNLTAHNRGSYWAGKINEMGSFVYADNQDSLRTEAERLVDFHLSGLSEDEVLGYLRRRGIEHTVLGEQGGPVHMSIQRLPVLV